MKDIENVGDKTLYGSFVPNFVRHRFSQGNGSQVVGQTGDGKAALLWLDVHHFSALCNRLMKESESGVQKISSILHEHYDFLLEEIVRFGGTPLFFVGDGLVAIWPTDQMSKEESIQRSISCAFEVLSKSQTRDDKNELISIHVVVAYGSWEMMELDGPHQKKHLSYYGEVFNELRSASQNRAPNHVLIRDSLISFIDGDLNTKPLEYETSILIDNPFDTSTLPPLNGFSDNYPDEALSKFEQFVPTTLKSPLSRERLEWLSEVRPVSVVFVRFDNSIENTEEKLRDTNELAKIVTPLVEKHDGLLNMIWTDEKATNILICFGPAPSAHVDNPLRSVKLSLEMNDVLDDQGYASSIGIGSGIAYCGVLGNDYLRQHTIIGDVVNLTARYAAIYTHGIVCDETTYKATRKTVSFDSPIHRKIKGESDSVRLFPVKRIETGDPSNEMLFSGRIVRRDKELNTILNSFNQTNADSSTLVVLDGESGMGKSTLRKTFLSEIDKDERIFINSANFIERKTPYYIWNEVILSILGLESNEVVDQSLTLKAIEARFKERSCLLNIVLHTNFEENEWFHGLTAAQKVEESERLLLEIFDVQGREGKLIIMIDNAQWIDEMSWRLIESMNNSLGNIFILLTFSGKASESGVDFSRFGNVEHVRLHGMNEEDLEKLLSTRIGIDSIPSELVSLTKKVAKGNPFFSLEFVNYLIDEELLQIDDASCTLVEGVNNGDHDLPDNIRGALRQRIDKLDPGSQLTLKVGSVVGYKFGKDIVGDIYPIMNERHYVNTYLDEAQSSGFLVDTVVDNYDGYFFNNSAVADVSYESILADQKRFLHEKSALWYEKNFEKNLQPFYVRLAYHWNQAGDKIKSLNYFRLESQ